LSADNAPDSPQAKSRPLARLIPEKDRYLVVARERYWDAGFAEREWQGVWSKVWTCAGRASDVAQTGQWLKYDLGRESIIVVRQKDGEIRAFHNACQHRGRRLVTADKGRCYSFVCPYHSWVYGLDGTNKRVTNRECFEPGALCGDLGLQRVRCEVWAGFIFVNVDPNAPPLMEYLDALPATLAAYRFETMHIVKDVSIEVPCNWKVGIEAFLEPYHAHITHPQILPAVDELFNQYDFYENGHARVITPVGLPSPRYGDQVNVNPGLAYMLQEARIDPESFHGTAHEVRAAIWAAKRKPDNPFGIDFCGFLDSQLTDDWNPSFFPNMTFNAHPEGVLVMRFLPHASDPMKCIYHVWVLLPKTRPGIRPPAYFGVEPEVDVSGSVRPAHRAATLDNPQLGELLEQDLANLPVIQQGLLSSGVRNGVRLSEMEQRIQQLHAEIDRRIANI
jgi:phenylpropionate dioxygenase-like ring-hydroxylating dioxygenase large terminal subunit